MHPIVTAPVFTPPVGGDWQEGTWMGAKRWLAGLARLVSVRLPREDERAVGGRLLRDCLGRQRGWAALLCLATVSRSAAALALPATVARAIDAAGTGTTLSTPLVDVGVVLAVLAAAEAIAELATSYYIAGTSAELQDRLVRHTLRLGLPGRRRFAAGDVLSRLAADTTRPASFLALAVGTVVALVTLVGAVVALGLIDWTLALAFVLGVPLALLAVRWFVSRAGELFLRYEQVQADIVTRLVDALQGARTIRASGTVQREISRILQPLPELNSTGRQGWVAQRQVSWQLLLLGPMLQILVLSVGGFSVAAGQVTPGELVAAAGYVLLALGGLEVVDGLADALHAHVGATRVATVLSSPPEIVTGSPGIALPPGPGRLELHDVVVRRGDQLVLDHLDLVVPAGASVAVVGRSGTGKTVLVSLVGRLLDPQHGDVRIDGTSVAALPLPQVRRAVTYAFERPALLGGTIHDTIAYTRPDASRAQVVQAACAAQADHFIRRLPEGYSTPVEAARLSGGEVQRLGLARAILSLARIVVLDDATSSLDTATEVKLTQALTRNLAGRTSLVVTHRPATAARADLVAWLDGGRIRALAPHAELWTDPDYRHTFAADPQPAGSSR